MKVLMINLPYAGHVVPTMGLVQQLIQKGCQVTYLMAQDWEDRIKESGADFVGYPNHRQLAEQMKNAWSVADQIVSDYDLVLYEQFFFLGKHLADKHHKPAVRIFTAPATNKTASTIHAVSTACIMALPALKVIISGRSRPMHKSRLVIRRERRSFFRKGSFFTGV